MNVVSVLEEVTGALEPHAARAGVSIDATFKDWDVPIVCVDRTRYRQILMNFASNAIKYNRSGGSLAFSFSLGECVLRITVIDTGMGIPLEHQPAVFNRSGEQDKRTGR